MQPRFVLGVDVTGDIGQVFVMWQGDMIIIDHGNKTLIQWPR